MKKICLLLLLALFTIQTFAQTREDTTGWRFHDDLLDNLVGQWYGTSIVHGGSFTLNFDAKWVLNHQYVRVRFKSREVVPWLKIPFEEDLFLGYNHTTKRYVAHEMTVHGSDGLYEGFSYAYRTGNEIKLVKKVGANPDTLNLQRFIWEPATHAWQMTSGLLIAGKEGEPFVDMKLIAVKPLSKKKKSLSK
ncbi:hypothetical protein ACPPVU_09735 [Mucilaginibacter sp. McL0603]|uniref:hypothetical protein n=1 Tax=Mucilaginibacter sp. McL0603 TaxID=3415670 RepID=UPI003CF95884